MVKDLTEMNKYSKKDIKNLNSMGFRDTFGKELIEIAKVYPDIVVVASDLSDATRVTEFSKQFPRNFFQVGIAEQNMISIAAGLSLNGKICFCTTFASFAALRCCEQVRNDICYQNLNVKIIGIDSGVSTGYLGVTHYGLEDIAIERAFSNMTVISPSDCLQFARLLWKLVALSGPVYVRFTGGKNVPAIYDEDRQFNIGKAVILKEGDEVNLIATGLMVSEAVKASELLKGKGIGVGVIDMHTIKPLDAEAVRNAAKRARLSVTVEEHNITGGLGSAVAEVIAESGLNSRLVRLGLPDEFFNVGSRDALLKRYGLSSENIADVILKNL